MIDKNLLSEVKKMAIGVVLLSVVMVAFFLIFGYFSYQVVLGALLGDAACIFNYYLLAVCVGKAVEKEEKDARTYMNGTYTLRMFVIAFAVIIAIKMPQYFNYIATAVTFIFPRIVIMYFETKKKKGDKINERTEDNI